MGTSQAFRILHSNDIHGHIDGLARIATLVQRNRAENAYLPVLYLDGGDSENFSVRLSNLTSGAGMHRLLNIAGCDAATVGNGGILHYGYHILKTYGDISRFPQLLANLRTPDGVVPPGGHAATILQVGTMRLGIIGLSENVNDTYTTLLGMQELSPVPLIRELAAQLRQDGADSVILLSHMGIENDRKLAAALQGELPLIIGAHSHTLLPEGERLGTVLLAQAGAYAQHLGCLDLFWDGSDLRIERIRVLPLTDDIPPAPEVLEEVARIEEEITQTLSETMSEVIADLAEPLTFAADQECGTANLMADMLRERMQADIALIAAGVAFSAPLPAGPLTRGTLWEVCSSPANPGVVEMTGEQVQILLQHGLNPDTAARQPGPLRGQPQGLLHLSGATLRDGTLCIGDVPLDPARRYRVAGSDWELDKQGGYTKAEWGLHPTYDIPTILREALDTYLRTKRVKIQVSLGRLGSSRLE